MFLAWRKPLIMMMAYWCFSTMAQELQEDYDYHDALPQDGTNRPCDNFYEYICNNVKWRNTKGEQGTKTEMDSFLDEALYKKLESILKEDTPQSSARADDKDNASGEDVKDLARKLYLACMGESKGSGVKEALQTVLELVGIPEWPFRTESAKSSKDILGTTGFRPVATVDVAPNQNNNKYILKLTLPFPRFAPYTPKIATIHRGSNLYVTYAAFIRSVVSLFIDEEISTQSNKENIEKEDLNCEAQDTVHAGKDLIICDILRVEEKLVTIMKEAKKQHDYGIQKLESWQSSFGEAVPLFAGLQSDFKGFTSKIGEDSDVAIQFKTYFSKLGELLKESQGREIGNYIGWFFLRDLADVLPHTIRENLAAFLKEAVKPNVTVELTSFSCIEKLIGHYGAMDDGMAYLYVTSFFNKSVASRGQYYANELKTKFEKVVGSEWLDEDSKKKANEWLGGLKLHVGARDETYDKTYAKDRYNLVRLPETVSLPLYVFLFKNNNYKQKLKLYGETYPMMSIWEESPLATTAMYSEFYQSVEMPAASLQDPILKYDAGAAHNLGSMGSWTGETMMTGLTDEGRLWLQREGKYAWTDYSKQRLTDLMKCLKIKSQEKEDMKNVASRQHKTKSAKTRRDRNRRTRRTNFDRGDDEDTLEMKLIDHVGLRVSYYTFLDLQGKCKAQLEHGRVCLNVDNETAQKRRQRFFASYVTRFCDEDATREDKDRVNFQLKTFEAFASAFNCVNGDEMKKPDTCHIVTSPSQE